MLAVFLAALEASVFAGALPAVEAGALEAVEAGLKSVQITLNATMNNDKLTLGAMAERRKWGRWWFLVKSEYRRQQTDNRI